MKIYEIITLCINFLVMIAGFSAIVIYIKQQREKRKTAATLILNQIDDIESTIEKFKDLYTHSSEKIINDESIYLSRAIPDVGAWDEYKHIVLKYLSQNEIEIINHFFENAYRVEKARADIIYCFKLNWNNKSLITQLMNGKFHDPTFVIPQEWNTNAFDLVKRFYEANNGQSFMPKIADDLLYSEIQNYVRINGTMVYEKLRKLSYRKK